METTPDERTLPRYDRTLTAAGVRKVWSESLSDAGTHGQHLLITRYRKPAAVLVQLSWYRRAKEAITAPQPRHVASEEARDTTARQLTDISEHDVHVVITVGAHQVAALVPVGWHTEAQRTLESDSADAADAEPDSSAAE
ncbi:hypothetical protein [Streptomyces sp. NPDC058268]|uniref:hypothetical protein n=1 Tax=Streptomyces sp. NPDC058268 TaxID=3346413 RepID=UPI0036EEC892